MAYSEPGTSPYKYDWQNPNRQTFDFGRVFGRAFSGVFSQFKSLATAVLIVLFITLLLSILSNQQVLKIIGDGTVANAINGPAYWGWSMMGSIPAMFFVLWVQLVVVLTSYAEFTKSNEVSTPLITALRFVLPMFVIALIYSIVSIAGFYLFLIGFIFVWPGWALAGPILVHEKKGIFGSIGEAWSQSRGSNYLYHHNCTLYSYGKRKYFCW